MSKNPSPMLGYLICHEFLLFAGRHHYKGAELKIHSFTPLLQQFFYIPNINVNGASQIAFGWQS